MIALRILAGFLFAALLTGCSINPFGESGQQLIDDVHSLRENLYGKPNKCLPQGATQTYKCFFSLTITDPDAAGGYVKGHVSVKACEQNRESGNSGMDCATDITYEDLFFKVKGAPKLRKNADYDFDSEPGYDILICRDKDSKPTTTDCWIRDRALDKVTAKPDMTAKPAN